MGVVDFCKRCCCRPGDVKPDAEETSRSSSEEGSRSETTEEKGAGKGLATVASNEFLESSSSSMSETEVNVTEQDFHLSQGDILWDVHDDDSLLQDLLTEEENRLAVDVDEDDGGGGSGSNIPRKVRFSS